VGVAVDERLQQSAQEVRASITHGTCDPLQFRAALMNVPVIERDAWVDAVLGLDEVLEDGPELPKGCVPYLPCAVDVLLRIADQLPVHSADVFVDIGSGMGRAAVLMHLLTGASAIGIEVQSGHVNAAREMVTGLGLSDVSFVLGDALERVEELRTGTVFFLYCPFGRQRLERFLANLEIHARARAIRVCAVDLPLPACSWLEHVGPASGDLGMYRSDVL
jgi:predicted RNA methylase